MPDEAIYELLEDYRAQGAPQDQQMLIALLREAQEMNGGAIKRQTLSLIAAEYGIKESFLQAMIRRVPALRLEDVPHSLEICGTCKAARELIEYMEKEYQVQNGADSRQGRFSFRVTGCMKNCRQGPSIRWDGSLYSRANAELLEKLIRNG